MSVRTPVAKEEAAQAEVELRMYRVIYDAINDVSDAMKGMLAPKVREVALGEAQVRQVYKISSVGTVAGCRVTDGKITRDAQLRLVRDGIVICEDSIASLKRFKDDAKEVCRGALSAASPWPSSRTSRKATSLSASRWRSTAIDCRGKVNANQKPWPYGPGYEA